MKNLECKFSNWDELLNFYKENYEELLELEMLTTQAVCKSKEFSDNEKAEFLVMGGHQRRLNWHPEQKNEAIEMLSQSKLWEKSFKDFEELYQKVKETIGGIKYIGPLTVYDVAKRIGSAQDTHPEKFVYLSCGAREGAENLLGPKVNIGRYPVEIFSKYFKDLSPSHVENILCVLKKAFIKDGINKAYDKGFKRWNKVKFWCNRDLGNKVHDFISNN